MDLQSRPGIKAKAMSSHAINNRVNALRSFFSWLHQQGYTEGRVLRDLEQPKTSKLVIEPLNHEEIQRLFAATNANTVLGARNSAIISLMLDTRLRLSEAAELKERDIHIEEQLTFPRS